MTKALTQYTHDLKGLQTEPLSTYLSALGVLRLVSEQVDPQAAASWKDNHFVLHTELNREQLEEFFLEYYQPTPLTSPWNGGSGYYDNKGKKFDALERIEKTSNPRFKAYADTIRQVRQILKLINLAEKPSPKHEKPALLRLLRGHLSDQSLKWLDCAWVLGETDHHRGFGPTCFALLGAGGCDGNFEFSNNFMQRLADLFLNDKAKPKQNAELLRSALFNDLSRYYQDSSIGQFDPGATGGVNLTVGHSAKRSMNPWLFILAMEGSLTLATAAVGRYKGSYTQGGRTGSSFPFTVTHLGVGNGKLAPEEGNRQELWLPQWEAPASYPEVRYLFSEGRAQNGKNQAKNPIEFSLALASFGTSRGLSGFTRYAFLQRNGDAHFATPLGFHPTGSRDGASLLRELEQWFGRSRGVISAHAAGAQRLINRYDSAVMEYLKTGKKSGFTRILECLGSLHQYVCQNKKLREKIRPWPTLPPRWSQEANDRSIEFRLAHSLACLGGGTQDSAYNMRAQLSPYDPVSRNWDENNFIPRWVGHDLTERMTNLLEYRLQAVHRKKKTSGDARANSGSDSPIRGTVGASPHDIAAFISGSIDETRLEKLLFALSLVKPPEQQALEQSWEPAFLVPQFIIPKLALHQGYGIRKRNHDDAEPELEPEEKRRDRRAPPLAIARMLGSGRTKSALREARRFLLSRPLIIPQELIQEKLQGFLRPRRLAAALLYPISDSTYRHLTRHLIDTNESQYYSIEESEQNYV